MIRKIFYFILFVAFAAAVWCAFALWTGLYSVYTIPPSRENLDGATLLINRDEGEPMFNSPHYTAPLKKPAEHSGLAFTAVQKPKRPVNQRTIVKLPYIDWAYKKSLQPQED